MSTLSNLHTLALYPWVERPWWIFLQVKPVLLMKHQLWSSLIWKLVELGNYCCVIILLSAESCQFLSSGSSLSGRYGKLGKNFNSFITDTIKLVLPSWSPFPLAPVARRKIWNFNFHLSHAAFGFPPPTFSASVVWRKLFLPSSWSYHHFWHHVGWLIKCTTDVRFLLLNDMMGDNMTLELFYVLCMSFASAHRPTLQVL